MKSFIIISVLLLIIICITTSLGTTLTLHKYADAAERGAVCNDGTPAGYYFSPGSGSGVNTWVVHMQGGWWCWDAESCFARAQQYPMLVSSTTWPNTIDLYGIFSTDPKSNPTFYNANLVYLGYCSSDIWSGYREANGTSGLDTWNFLGESVLAAAIQDLRSIGMNNSNTQILLTGCSSGGNGVYANIDHFKALLHFTPQKFVGFADAGWMANYYTNNPLSIFNQYQMGQPLWEGVSNLYCTGANPTAPFICYFGTISQPYIKTPILTHMEQYDIIEFSMNCNCTYNDSSSSDQSNMYNLKAATLYSTFMVKPPHTIFAPACAHHCASLGPEFTTISIGGVTLAAYLDKFWAVGASSNLVDTCGYFNCSNGCPGSTGAPAYLLDAALYD